MTDIWVLYHQTGPDGQEWGVKIRPGYIVTGFSREDAEAVVAWQNASCRPACNILELAKALRSSAFGTHKQALDVVDELIAEVERLRSAPKSGLYGKYIIQKADGSPVDPHADYFVLRLDTDPYARIAALEYAIQTDDQTLGEMLKKRVLDHVYSEDDQCRKRAEAWPLGMIKKLRGEVARLRSDFSHLEIDCSAWRRSSERKDTRIEELEAIREQFYRHINRERGRVRFAFNQSQELILARARIKELEADIRKAIAARDEWVGIANQERMNLDRLEAALLKPETIDLLIQIVGAGATTSRAVRKIEQADMWDAVYDELQTAREALEKIRRGEKDE